MAMHVFVAMPYGVKEGIDFNAVYDEYIKPALESAGFEVFRADEELRAGSIHKDMFQELLLADLVVVDLSIDNPNVWYELGARHALRARGVVQIQCQRDYLPFDVYGQRALRYRVKDGRPDPDHLNDDKDALATMSVETMEAWHGLKVSPVYDLLTYLKEPDWKSLRVAGIREFWDLYKEWADRVELARKRNHPGDILVLADEAPTWVLRLEAYNTAGKALLSLGHFDFALEQYENALDIDPTDLESRRQKGLILGRCGKHDEAKIWLKRIVEDHPEDAETWAFIGRIEKDAWLSSWRQEGKTAEEMQLAATDADAYLREAIKAYAKGFRKNPIHYYSGINAVTLMHLLSHLTGDDEKTEELKTMEGGVRWAVYTELARKPKEYWARVTLADLEVLIGNKDVVERAYKDAVAVAEKNWFDLDSSRQQLLILQDLGFRPQEVEAALNVLDRELAKIKTPDEEWEPRLVFLFSGHMIDAPDRAEPRFPADKENIAAQAIARKLDELGAGPDDLALCGGACGGDLLFAEACLERDLHLEIRIPFNEPKFLQKSVTFAKDNWRDRFYKVKDHQNTKLAILPEELGPPPKGINSYARNNLWQLYTALARGLHKVRFICLWNRKGGDGPGGTEHMHDTVRKHSGHVYVLDTNKL
jgi:tetratricopeptide (TPR) repeat protein